MRREFLTCKVENASMERDEICVCGHYKSVHRTYGCTVWKQNPDKKQPERVWCQCKGFVARKAAAAGR